MEKTNIFVVYIEQSGSFWGRERVGGTWANRLLKINGDRMHTGLVFNHCEAKSSSHLRFYLKGVC